MDTLIAHLTGIPAARLQAVALWLLSVALVVLAIALFGRAQREARTRATVDTAIAARSRQPAPGPAADPRSRWQAAGLAAVGLAERLGRAWEAGRFGRALLAPEDRALVERCGFLRPARARSLFVFGRLALALLLPLLAGWAWGGWPVLGSSLLGAAVLAFLGFGLGWMLPKWALARRVRWRQRRAAEELPLLIDLLRLLQGVGLSIDQSLRVIASEFAAVMPVLAGELGIAVERHAHGIPREQSLVRVATTFDNDDLAAIVRLIAQVDRHGGAVQEPLRLFSERVREKRRMQMKAEVGRLTVKMTAVMVVTLLPALLIVTGGAGFLALFRGLAGVAGGS